MSQKAPHLHVQKTIVTEETKQILGGGFKHFLFKVLARVSFQLGTLFLLTTRVGLSA